MASVRSGAWWLGSGVAFLMGCGTDAVVGTWQSQYETDGNRDEFTLTADVNVCNEETGRAELCGEGTFFLPQFCNVLVDATPGDDDRYDIVVNSTGCADDLALSCQLNDDDNVLSCQDGKAFSLIARPEE